MAMDLESETRVDGQDAQYHFPDLSDIVREGPDAGTGTGAPDVDGDRERAHKAPPQPPPLIDGVVPPRDLRLQHQREHPELVEDLKAFLGVKAAQQSTQLEPPAHELGAVELADPYHTKPPQPSSVPQPACAEAMSAYDGQVPGTDPEVPPEGGADAASSVLDCASPGGTLAVAGPSRHDHDDVDGDPRHCPHGQHAHDPHSGGPTSVEDKCLECCVYYGVLCCQCTIS